MWTDQFNEFDNVLHLDVDTLVLKPFGELFQKKEFFAIHDFTPLGEVLFKREVHNDIELRQRLVDDGIYEEPNKIKMLNAGMFVIPKKYRTAEQFNSLWKLTKRYSKYTNFADQAAISLWAYRNNISFSDDIKYNFQLSFVSNPFIFFNIVAKDFELLEVKIAHYSWWKPDSRYFGKHEEVCQFFNSLKVLGKSIE